MPGVEVYKLVATLYINRSVELQRLERPRLHGVVHVFMIVNVLSKLKEAMLGKLDGMAGNHGSRAKSWRDAILGREAVETERLCINDFSYEDTWDTDIYSDQVCVH